VVCKAASRHPAALDERPVHVRRAETASRAADKAASKAASKPPPPPTKDGLIVRDLEVPVDSATMTVRSYRPDIAGELPLHLYAHGGSFWSGNLDQVDAMSRLYAASAQCVVLSIDYRLAPEHTWPTAAEDYYAALEWAVAHAGELGVDVDRVSVGGVSCGANLAAVVTLMARDRGGPSLVFQLLEIPSTDATMSQPSMRTLASGYLITAAALAQGYDYYLPPGVDRTHPYASPLLADDLAGLPPAMILTCEFDPLRDEGEAYARLLRAHGVAVAAVRARGHIHSSTYSSSPLLPSARKYRLLTVDALRRAYEGS
jgi:acetyl esterase